MGLALGPVVPGCVDRCPDSSPLLGPDWRIATRMRKKEKEEGRSLAKGASLVFALKSITQTHLPPDQHPARRSGHMLPTRSPA